MAKSINCKPCGESSPYQDWVASKGYTLTDEGREKFIAHNKHNKFLEAVAVCDPDTLEAPEVKQAEPLLQAILDVLDEGGEQVLTKKQQKAFQLLVREGLSYRATARQMRVSVRAVQDLVAAGAKKLRILALTK